MLAGVSGGPDSMCLLHVLHRFREEFHISLRVAHLHHHMREEADRDAEMVEEFARSLGIPTSIGHADVNKLAHELAIGVEEAGREARYRFFRELSESTGAVRVALGHNQNDQAETVLMRLFRGSGVRGLAGIPPVNGNVVRPLIEVPREWIEEYCAENKIPVMTDVYNLDLRYTRNLVRHKTLPELAASYNPSLVETLAGVAASLRLDADFLDETALEAFDKYTCRHGRVTLVSSEGLRALKPAVALRVVDMAWHEVWQGDGNLGMTHAVEILECAGKAVSLPGRITAVHEGDFVVFYPEAPGQVERTLDVPGESHIPELGITVEVRPVEPKDAGVVGALAGQVDESTPSPARGGSKCVKSGFPLEREDVAFLDWSWSDKPLKVRTRRDGDRFQPLGMRGSEQKLQDFFIQRRVPKFYRDFVPIFVFGDKIAWVGGFRLDERFKVTKSSQKVLRVEVKRSLRHSRNCVTI